MLRANKKLKRVLRRVLSAAFAFGMLAAALPRPEAALSAVNDVVELYHWYRITDPKTEFVAWEDMYDRIMLMWPKKVKVNGTEQTYYYYTDNSGFDTDRIYSSTFVGEPGKPSSKFISLDNEFVTLDHCNSLRVFPSGADSDNDGEPRWYIMRDDGKYIHGDEDENALVYKDTSEGKYSWTFTNKECESGKISIFLNSGGYDEHWSYKDNYIHLDWYHISRDFPDFYMYAGKTERYDAITKDFTVKAGDVQYINSRVILMDGVTLTVEEGGLLVVNEELFNNGTIVNHGTVVVAENACVMPFYAKGGQGGSILCDGGALVMMENAKVLADEAKASVIVKNGGSVINNGILICDKLELVDSEYRGSPSSYLFAGGRVSVSRYNAKGITRTADGLISDTGISVGYGHVMMFDSHFVNEGTMIRSGVNIFITREKVKNAKFETTGRNEGQYACYGEY